MGLNVDFQFKGWDCAVFYGALRWKPGNPETAQLTSAWDDDWAKERFWMFAQEKMNLILDERRRDMASKWTKRQFDGSFTRDDIKEILTYAHEQIKRLVRKETESLPNLDKIPGRKIEVE